MRGSRRARTIAISAAIVALALVFSACASPITEAVEAGDLTELQTIEELQQAFNDDLGTPRLIVLLSPT